MNQYNNEEVVCIQCSQKYPIQNNIPLISSDIETIIQDIEKRKTEKPNWYIESQIQNRCNYLYRHHLKKRRIYLKDVFLYKIF